MSPRQLLFPLAVVAACFPQSQAATYVTSASFNDFTGGTRTLTLQKLVLGAGESLQSVKIKLMFEQMGGSLMIDNDSNYSGASTVTQSLHQSLSSSSVSLLDDDDNLILQNISASNIDNITIGADDGDGAPLWSTSGPDFWEKVYSDSVSTMSQRTIGSLYQDEFLSDGNSMEFDLTLSASQSFGVSNISAYSRLNTSATSQGSITVTYGTLGAGGSLPEPGVAILGCVGWLALLWRRGRELKSPVGAT